MAIVINQVTGQSAFALGDANIAYDSFFLRSDVTTVADSEDPGQEIENGVSWPTYGGGWQTTTTGDHEVTAGFPGTRAGNCYALHKHNLNDLGITVQLETSDDGITFTPVVGTDITPGDNKTVFVVLDAEETHPFWRLKFTGHVSGTLRIAQIFIGPCFQTFTGPNTGWTPPNLALNDDFITSRADGGDFLGRSLIRRGGKTGFSLSAVTQGWIREFWEPFMLAAEEHPFYYSWDSINFPGEVAYCYTDKKIDIPRYTTHLHMDLSLSFIALQL